MSSNSKLDELIDRLPVRTRPSYGYQPLMDEAADAIEALRSTPPQPGQERKDKALMAASMRAIEVEPHLEVYLSRDDFEHIFQQAFEAYDNVMATGPAPTEAPPVESQAAEPDYCFDPEEWEFTFRWSDRDEVHGHGESLNRRDPMRVCTLMKGPDKWVADVPITWDENGDPGDTEIKWFDSEEEALAALSPVEQAPQPVGEEWTPPAHWCQKCLADPTEEQGRHLINTCVSAACLFNPAPTEAPPVESQAAGWQPITTAPISNGSNSFLAYITGHGPHVCYAGAGRYIYSVSTGKRIHRATHWMTFPPPPALAAEGSAE